LSLEQLGSDVNSRITAAKNQPADVAGPYSTATLDVNERRWLTYPEGPCLKFLPPPPKKAAAKKTSRKPS
jgi:hypothetical protein